MVVMSAGSVHVAVRELFLGRGADVGDFDVEVQVLSRERMIAVDRDHVAGNLRHRHGAHAVPGLRMELHADNASPAGERQLYADIEKATGDLAVASLDAIAYGCTAGSLVMPLAKLTDFMTGVAGVPCVATASALVHACRALGLARVALATPYHDALNEHERAFLADNAIAVVAIKGLGIGAGGPQEYVRIARVPAEDVYAHARSADRPDAQGLLISCTDLATLAAIPRLEHDLGKPVVTSNQATFWAALRSRMELPSSPNDTSSCQCRLFSMPQ